jgi:soluble P-type ATPase
VSIVVAIPGRSPLALTHLVLDVNGTLSDRGVLVDGVADRIGRLRTQLEVMIASADTFGGAADLAARLGVDVLVVADGGEKAALVDWLGAPSCVAIGNGANDVPMLERATLGIAVVGPEGASGRALAAADVVCRSVVEALDLLLDPRLLIATLRS